MFCVLMLSSVITIEIQLFLPDFPLKTGPQQKPHWEQRLNKTYDDIKLTRHQGLNKTLITAAVATMLSV